MKFYQNLSKDSEDMHTGPIMPRNKVKNTKCPQGELE
jgi:hypothetical protein